ncbi:MAG: DinB family protein [Candidatus Hodarchaeales archaeon]|jgi:uncharacterized damage-inducible protein DinB
MKDKMITLMKLNYWANDHFRNVMDPLSISDLNQKTPYGTILDLVIHHFNATNRWLSRLGYEPLKEKETSFENLQWKEILTEWEKTDKKLIQYVESINDEDFFHNTISYVIPKGKFSNKVEEILIHLTHHGYYHRGQLAILLRQYNLPPAPATDAMVFFREVQES